MPPNRFESEVESFLEGSHGDRTHIKRADHHTVTPLCGTLLSARGRWLGQSAAPVGNIRYKRRQSKPKNRHYQRKSPRIDDVRNNGAEIHTKNTLN